MTAAGILVAVRAWAPRAGAKKAGIGWQSRTLAPRAGRWSSTQRRRSTRGRDCGSGSSALTERWPSVITRISPPPPAAGTPGLLTDAIRTTGAARSTRRGITRAIEVPLDYQLLAESGVHLARGQYRHAVVSACSAAEVALSAEAARLLRGAGWTENDVQAILRRANGVTELYRLTAVRRHGLPVSIGQVMNQLAAPRNRAVHAGEELAQDAVLNAIGTSRALLTVTRLPGPRALARAGAA